MRGPAGPSPALQGDVACAGRGLGTCSAVCSSRRRVSDLRLQGVDGALPFATSGDGAPPAAPRRRAAQSAVLCSRHGVAADRPRAEPAFSGSGGVCAGAWHAGLSNVWRARGGDAAGDPAPAQGPGVRAPARPHTEGAAVLVRACAGERVGECANPGHSDFLGLLSRAPGPGPRHHSGL